MQERTKKIVLLITGGGLLAAIAVVLAFGVTSYASAKGTNALGTSPGRISAHMGFGFPGGFSEDDEFLADALGISVEEMQDAKQEASDAAIQAALDQGLITQELADAMTLGGFFGGRGFHGGANGSVWGDIDYDALLAEALGITVEELQSAREEAQDAMLAQAVADGLITQEQADLLKAQQALKAYLDYDVLLAEALGVTSEQLQSFRDEGLTLSEILAEVDMTAAEVRDALQAAREAAIQQAVDDGVITQDQADQLALGGLRMGGPGGFGRHGGFGGGFGPGGFFAPDSPTQPETEGTGL